MSVTAYRFFFFCFSSSRSTNLIFQKSDFVLFLYFTLSSPKTNSGSLGTKLPHTLLIVNPPIFYCTLSYRSPGPHGKIVLGP